jgi:hypothetical protein
MRGWRQAKWSLSSLFRRARSMRVLMLAVVSVLPVVGCADLGKGQSASGGAAPESTPTADLDSVQARAVVDRLGGRHPVRQRAVGPSGTPTLPSALALPSAPILRPLIGPSSSGRFMRADQRLQAKWKLESAVDVWVPVRSAEAFGVRDRATGMAVQAKLAGARDATAAVADGLAVYEGAGPTGGTVVHRLTEAGTEDYVTFETRPADGELSYEVSMSGVEGLRLVGNSLEFVDAASTPRLRISPPFVVGARGEVVEAELSVAGCAVGPGTGCPGKRYLPRRRPMGRGRGLLSGDRGPLLERHSQHGDRALVVHRRRDQHQSRLGFRRLLADVRRVELGGAL